jgi:hypothetical protein
MVFYRFNCRGYVFRFITRKGFVGMRHFMVVI